MTLKIDNKTATSLMQSLTANGTDGFAEILKVLLNEVMKAERSEALEAQPYERTGTRKGYANGFKKKKLKSRVGTIELDIPQVRGMRFYPKSLEKGCRSERALKAAIAEMYVNGVSTRRVTEITEKLCGLELSSTQVSRLSKILDDEIEAFKNRPLGQIPYVILDARYERVRHKGCVRDVAVLVATGINLKGKREVLGFSVSMSEAEVHWRTFLQTLTQRGLHGVEYIVSDDHEGLKAARKAVFPSVIWQRCQFHFAQNAQSYAPKRALRKPIAEAVRDILNSPSVEDALAMKEKIVDKFKDSAPLFVKWLDLNVEECLAVYALPRSFHVKLRTVNSLENLNREIKRRTFLASIFPNEQACSRLVGAVLMEVHETWISDPLNYLFMPDREELLKNNKIYRRKVA